VVVPLAAPLVSASLPVMTLAAWLPVLVLVLVEWWVALPGVLVLPGRGLRCGRYGGGCGLSGVVAWWQTKELARRLFKPGCVNRRLCWNVDDAFALLHQLAAVCLQRRLERQPLRGTQPAHFILSRRGLQFVSRSTDVELDSALSVGAVGAGRCQGERPGLWPVQTIQHQQDSPVIQA